MPVDCLFGQNRSMKGEILSFQCGGETYTGYLSKAGSGKGPGVIVIQEWWGLVGHIKSVCDRFAVEGFTALAPDLYHGKATTEPDEAQKAMMELKLEDASRDLGAA